MKITQITRRDIVDAIIVGKINWSGRLEEAEFLSRLYDLQSLPSGDRRFSDAAGDIWQHRVNNFDWEEDWVFYDRRFNLMTGAGLNVWKFDCRIIRSGAARVTRMQSKNPTAGDLASSCDCMSFPFLSQDNLNLRSC